MNLIERACVTIRHSPGLTNAGWLWNAARPLYDSVINTIGCRGLPRVMNGADHILIDAKYRGLGEVYEPDVWRHLMSNVKPGDVIADVGAHIGLYTVALAKRVGPHGRVVAFEPDKKTLSDLRRHIQLNQVATVAEAVGAAVAACDGQIGFTCDQDTQNRIALERTPVDSNVPAVRLDSFFKRGQLDILKVDVEGFEEDVLKGGEELLSDRFRAPRLIYLEVHPYNWVLCGTTSESLLRRLHDANYEVETPGWEPCRNICRYGEVIAHRTISEAKRKALNAEPWVE